jgi:8-oxo-dGTP pyrophosphatase MutT (NUDIX family)
MVTKILNNVRLIQKCLIVGKDGKILALKRAADDHSRGGNWDLPGGGYEYGEEVIAAIKREVMEEVGLTVNSLRPVFFANRMGVGEGFFRGDTVFATCYMSSDWEGEVVISSEHTEYKWVNPEEFRSYDFGADSGFFLEAIDAYLNS